MPFTPPAPDELRRQLAAIRTWRRAAYAAILAPVAFILLLVVLNRFTDGAAHVFVSGAPWTRVFWSGVFWTFVAGLAMLVFVVARRCPGCGDGFFVSKSYRRSNRGTGGGGVNVFANRCANCKLPLA